MFYPANIAIIFISFAVLGLFLYAWHVSCYFRKKSTQSMISEIIKIVLTNGREEAVKEIERRVVQWIEEEKEEKIDISAMLSELEQFEKKAGKAACQISELKEIINKYR